MNLNGLLLQGLDGRSFLCTTRRSSPRMIVTANTAGSTSVSSSSLYSSSDSVFELAIVTLSSLFKALKLLYKCRIADSATKSEGPPQSPNLPFNQALKRGYFADKGVKVGLSYFGKTKTGLTLRTTLMKRHFGFEYSICVINNCA